MRPVSRFCLVLVSCMAFFAGPVFAGHHRVLGVVSQTDRGHLDSQDAQLGANVYSCDLMDTNSGGEMRVRVAQNQLYLSPMSTAQLEDEGGDIQILAESGTIAFSEPSTGNLSVRTPAGVIRAEGGSSVAGQVTYKTPTEIIITAVHGNLTLDNGGDLRSIPEGKSADVTFTDPLLVGCHEAAAADQSQPGPPRKIGLVWIIPPALAIPSYILWHQMTESQSKPN